MVSLNAMSDGEAVAWLEQSQCDFAAEHARVAGSAQLAATRKFHNVKGHPNVAFLVDDVLPPWQPRALMVQGRAEAILASPRGEDGPTEAMLRITPERIIAWGLRYTPRLDATPP